MTNFEKYKMNEKQRIDNLTINELAHDLINNSESNFCCYCIHYGKEKCVGNSCTQGVINYLKIEE